MMVLFDAVGVNFLDLVPLYVVVVRLGERHRNAFRVLQGTKRKESIHNDGILQYVYTMFFNRRSRFLL